MRLDYVVCGLIVHEEKVLLILNKKLERWLPPGGHIEKNETPDEALHREIKEEVGLEVEIYSQSTLPVGGTVVRNCAVPFYTNVHHVLDHDHYCMFFLCKPKSTHVVAAENEIGGYRWFSYEELSEDIVPDDVKHMGREALRLSKELF